MRKWKLATTHTYTHTHGKIPFQTHTYVIHRGFGLSTELQAGVVGANEGEGEEEEDRKEEEEEGGEKEEEEEAEAVDQQVWPDIEKRAAAKIAAAIERAQDKIAEGQIAAQEKAQEAADAARRKLSTQYTAAEHEQAREEDVQVENDSGAEWI